MTWESDGEGRNRPNCGGNGNSAESREHLLGIPVYFLTKTSPTGKGSLGRGPGTRALPGVATPKPSQSHCQVRTQENPQPFPLRIWLGVFSVVANLSGLHCSGYYNPLCSYGNCDDQCQPSRLIMAFTCAYSTRSRSYRTLLRISE